MISFDRLRGYSTNRPNRQGGIFALQLGQRHGAYLPKDLAPGVRRSSFIAMRDKSMAQSCRHSGNILARASISFQVPEKSSIKEVFLQETCTNSLANADSYIQTITRMFGELALLSSVLAGERKLLRDLRLDLEGVGAASQRELSRVKEVTFEGKRNLKDDAKQNLRICKSELLVNKRECEQLELQFSNLKHQEQVCVDELLELEDTLQ